jgi:hypothetical protein
MFAIENQRWSESFGDVLVLDKLNQKVIEEEARDCRFFLPCPFWLCALLRSLARRPSARLDHLQREGAFPLGSTPFLRGDLLGKVV